MYDLYYYVSNTNIIGYNIEILDLLFFSSIISGILVITSKNPVISVLYLIGLFLSVSCYLLILGLNFIGLSYLLVYVGAVSILFIFILMLINVRISELLTNNINSLPLSLILSIFFYYIIYIILPGIKPKYYNILNINDDLYYINSNFLRKKIDLIFVSSKTWDGGLGETTHISTIGNIMYTNYLMWLFLISMILLLAMVGAIVITIKQNKYEY